MNTPKTEAQINDEGDLARLKQIGDHLEKIEKQEEVARNLMSDSAVHSMILTLELEAIERRRRFMKAAEAGELHADTRDNLFDFCTIVYGEDWDHHMLRIIRANPDMRSIEQTYWYKGRVIIIPLDAAAEAAKAAKAAPVMDFGTDEPVVETDDPNDTEDGSS